MQQPEPRPKSYAGLFNDIDEGRVKIPVFQRDFVWEKPETAKLIDSILKGFPIGTFILWKTKERLRHMRNIGNIKLPEPPKGDSIQYVLDGQQRMTSLYAVHKGVRITRDNEEIDYTDIAIDLNKSTDDDEIVLSSITHRKNGCISVHMLLTADTKTLIDKFEPHIEKIDLYRTALRTYSFSVIEINEYPIDIACEIFTRINTSGKGLTLFEIMVAKTYDQEQKFDLAKRYDNLIDAENGGKDLESANYETIPAVTVLQCAAVHICREIKRSDILKLQRDEFINSWDEVQSGIFDAIDYLRTHLRIAVSKILPYNSLLIPLTWFFIQKNHAPADTRENYFLRQYVYWASLTNRFTSAVETKIASDLKRMEAILSGDNPEYHGEEINVDKEKLMWHSFSAGDAFCKAIICLLSCRGPKRFNTSAQVLLDNSNLKASTSKNYHHFFPRAFLKKNGFDDSRNNSIMNIVLVDDYLNKRKIKARPPSEYVREFEEENPNIGKVFDTHYISSPEEMGIYNDDYELFIEKRAALIAEALNEILNPDVH